MFTLKDYVGHVLIGTPLETPIRILRYVMQSSQRWKNPELNEIYVESSRVEHLMERVIHDSMNCIDVGSHLGSMIDRMKRLSPKGQHIAVEPIPYKAHWLKKKYPNVEVLQIALNDKTGEEEFFFQPSRSAYSGLRLNGSGEEKVELIRVKCMRLDEVVPSDRPIGFMKIIAEGAELPILRGSEQILQRSHPIVLFECIRGELDTFGIDPKDVYDFLVQQHNYSVFLLKDWFENREPLSYEAFVQAMQYPFQAFRFLAVHKG
jgi:FkbM family methyltransferase